MESELISLVKDELELKFEIEEKANEVVKANTHTEGDNIYLFIHGD